ncbi:Serine/threonine-protein kinase RAD53 [Fusarium oxysporum f. sp. conglutinans]|nr:Serine/threonine-protein kinase RAD53 [Fusarium oxysporum f. sp. conglutinans]
MTHNNMEEQFSDIVRDFKLVTKHNGNLIVHLYNDPDAHPSAPQRQEHWREEERIDGGSQGTVWLQTCVRGSRHFTKRAVKKFLVGNRDSRLSYERELVAIVKFSHDRYSRYFVKSLGWYTSSSLLHIAMEYFPAGNLYTYVEEQQGLPEDECWQITSQVLSGIALMHEEGFAHRDLKPQNILIYERPPAQWWIKLADFGLSKNVITDPNNTDYALGTPGYIAPELYDADQRRCSTRDPQKPDIWALGVTALFILTNTVPFSGQDQTTQFAANRFPFPCAPLRSRNVSEQGQAFILDAMKPNPGNRMNSTAALQHPWTRARMPNCPLSTISCQSSLNDMGELSAVISTLSSEPSTQGHIGRPFSNLSSLLPTIRGSSVPQPTQSQSQILGNDTNATTTIIPAGGLAANLEDYWGSFITPNRTPSHTFANLICSIFSHFQNTNGDILRPHEFCAFMFAAGWSPQDFPPIQVFLSHYPQTPVALRQGDAYLANCYRQYPLDHLMGTREAAALAPIQPHEGRIRTRDQLMYGLANLLVPDVSNGMPLLTQRGFGQYLVFMAMASPDELFVRLNRLLSAIGPQLRDSRTSRPFEAHIPRSCLPPAPGSIDQIWRVMAETRVAVSRLQSPTIYCNSELANSPFFNIGV